MSSRLPDISAIICTHNPRAAFLKRVLSALEAQSLPRDRWELLIVDSGSSPAIADRSDLQLPSFARLVRLAQPGLALARKAGAEAARSALLASVDDDTVFDPSYLELAVMFMDRHPQVACCGGKFVPEFEIPPPVWFEGFHAIIAIRDLGPRVIVVPGLQAGEKLAAFPHAAPIGVSVSRRPAFEHYLKRWGTEAGHAALGRSGQSLASGEDNDFSLCCLEAGWSLAYVPEMRLLHLMPAARLDPDYLARLNRASSRTWMHVLALHGLCPRPPISPWTVPLRQLKAWFTFRAWAGPAQRIRWQGACGNFEGLATINAR